jgi:hypothetical protein
MKTPLGDSLVDLLQGYIIKVATLIAFSSSSRQVESMGFDFYNRKKRYERDL